MKLLAEYLSSSGHVLGRGAVFVVAHCFVRDMKLSFVAWRHNALAGKMNISVNIDGSCGSAASAFAIAFATTAAALPVNCGICVRVRHISASYVCVAYVSYAP